MHAPYLPTWYSWLPQPPRTSRPTDRHRVSAFVPLRGAREAARPPAWSRLFRVILLPRQRRAMARRRGHEHTIRLLPPGVRLSAVLSGSRVAVWCRYWCRLAVGNHRRPSRWAATGSQVSQRIPDETPFSPRPRLHPRSAFRADNVGSNPARDTSLSPPAVDYAQQGGRDQPLAGQRARRAASSWRRPAPGLPHTAD